MNWELFLQYYLIIGVIYCLINAFIRRIDIDGDSHLPLMWLFLWGMCVVAHIIAYFIKVKHKL